MSEQGLVTQEMSTFDVSVSLDLSDQEMRIADALRRCIGRWGMAKTTIDDIAREAGVSRATVYRQFPGGKSAILSAAVNADVQRLLNLLSGELAALDDLESCLVAALHKSAVFLDAHPVLRYMREHESAELEQILGFERTDAALITCGEAMVPMLSRFLPAEKAFDAGMWGARILISYLAEDPLHVDLLEPEDVRRVVRTFMIPGLLADGIQVDLNLTFSNPSPEIQTES
ncbi:MAG: TetR/AcrR family transcriptional regulator [Microthrixaceae bacterium]